MGKSKILGNMGDNYIMSDCPFALPKENLKMFQSMQDAGSKDPYNNYKQYGNVCSSDWKKSYK